MLLILFDHSGMSLYIIILKLEFPNKKKKGKANVSFDVTIPFGSEYYEA
jgi:hypothetical protein